MELKINRYASMLKPSLIREMKVLADKYNDVIDFTLGEPHISRHTYEVIQEGLHHKMMESSLGYSHQYGIIELRMAISEYCKHNYGQIYDPYSEIIITTGVSEPISAVFKTILEEDDEVIIFSPSFTLYNTNVQMYGGKVVLYDMVENDMQVKEEVLSRLITAKTKAILVNSPCNPTGKIFSEEENEVIYNCIKDKPIFVISDEIYREIVFEQKKCCSLSKYPRLRDRLFILNGFSKSYAMTGWRIGYVLGPKEFINTVAVVHQNFVASASTISQYAALEALNHPELTKNIQQLYEKNRNYVYQQLKPYFKHVVLPEGAFYLYIDVSNYGLTSYEFAMNLLKSKQVAIVPSMAFEPNDSGYVRLSYCCDFETLRAGVLRIQNFIKSL
ncbi:MAG: aminotransferase class I/II-fold pyridoxal phosphate-dependent enzyme [Turicibacter sp.]|jgi:aminotransferase|uniref:Aminotransferase n=1 Tax=Turicibacter faecis TaxID=2963365 RepID=A0ABM8IHH1_9FIRM|nr:MULTISPECIES: aminotransferase class I/II-fold pyridoxal phosphate-dependent enzyme [unclassified Turicibacter]MCI8701968.1 aminotransferase class I/II-fold pyridoxal phosphate-dependent enzyme [Turicibacter sp.]BEH90114.1 aminotransferase [Turicibacter sp. TC023]MCU7204645.1 aminotransferase class I/II-fold pyridoxal phosphate-dependent enzyme [Turicibacter sp. TA25]MCU7210125.1 aminotransferase class I/II-fold pyridoxal phosphate-dependent enzyme [Turicibacter sp. 1E2]NCE78840.1 aminotran